MITNFFYWVAELFDKLFLILPYIGRIGNILFILIGFIGTFYWLNYMAKNRLSKKGHR